MASNRKWCVNLPPALLRRFDLRTTTAHLHVARLPPFGVSGCPTALRTCACLVKRSNHGTLLSLRATQRPRVPVKRRPAAAAMSSSPQSSRSPPQNGSKSPNSNTASDANIRNFAPVARIMKTALPENAKIAKEAKECMQECVSEFISFITSEGEFWSDLLRDRH